MQNFKRSVGALLALLSVATALQAAQTVDPTLTPGGASIAGQTIAVPAGTNFSFYGMYSDDSVGAAESGLGLKVKYNPAVLTNVADITVTEQYTKCRIAAAQVQSLTASTAQVVMGWIDTATRTTPAVGWPDLPDAISATETALCLNPGAINTDFGAGSASAQKLFKVTGTMPPACTSNTPACTTTILLTSEGNFSYANGAGSTFTDKSFIITGAAAPTQALAAVPYVSRKTHGAAGVFDIALNPSITVADGTSATVTTVEPRSAQSGTHQIVVAFAAGVSAAQFPTVTAVAGVTSLPVSTSFNGSEMTITIGSIGIPVPDRTRVLVSATGVGAAAGVNPSIAVAFLLGDVTQSGGVNNGDIGTVRGLLGTTTVNSTNFRSDVVVTGGINNADLGTVRGQNGVSLP